MRFLFSVSSCNKTSHGSRAPRGALFGLLFACFSMGVGQAQTLSGTADGDGTVGQGITSTGLSTPSLTDGDRSDVNFWYSSNGNISAVPPMDPTPSAGTTFVTMTVISNETIAAGDARERFSGTVSGLTVGADYTFTIYVGGTQYQEFDWGARCPALGLEVDGIKNQVSTTTDGKWETLTVPFTASASSVYFESHADGILGPYAGGGTTTTGCLANYAFDANAVQLVDNTDSDGDGEADVIDPAPSDPCTDSSGTGTSTYAQANCVDLQLVKSGGTQQGSCGVGEVEWFLTASNNGPADATDVLVNDYPIAGITGIVSTSSTSCTALPCTIPSLTVGASEVITVCTN